LGALLGGFRDRKAPFRSHAAVGILRSAVVVAIISSALSLVHRNLLFRAAAAASLTRSSERHREIFMSLCSCRSFGTISLSNFSLLYLNYATQVIFKSSKVIPVMVVGAIVWRKRFTLEQYAAAAVLVVGLVTVSALPRSPPSGRVERTAHIDSLFRS
jgi:hypothetical protein